MIQTVFTAPFKEEQMAPLAGIPGYSFSFAGREITPELRRAEVVIGAPSADQLAAAEQLRWLQIPSSGADAFMDPARGLRPDVALTVMSGAFGQSISEYVLAMVLSVYKKLELYRDGQREHLWNDLGVHYSPRGRNLLIWGTGDIGTHVADLFRVFGCTVTGCRKHPDLPAPGFDRVIGMEDLETELSAADIVVCCVPSTGETRHYFTEERLRLLKKDAVLVNVGRGDLIDLDALAGVLREGHLYGAALDVTSPEPLPPEHPLWDCPNCILTPHITGRTFGHMKATEDNMYRIIGENMQRYRDGGTLLNALDRNTGYRTKENRA